jgi:hypothetical protein
MVSLREECLALVARGETTLEEVLRVTHDWRPAAPAPEPSKQPKGRSRAKEDSAEIVVADAEGDAPPATDAAGVDDTD